jgi:hypothetical protein
MLSPYTEEPMSTNIMTILPEAYESDLVGGQPVPKECPNIPGRISSRICRTQKNLGVGTPPFVISPTMCEEEFGV